MSVSLPDAPYAAMLLGMLFDGLTVKPGAKLDAAKGAGVYCAVYVGDDGAAAVFCACDINFAASAGAALSMMPPGAAKEAIKTKELTGVMQSNLHEVMNICTRLVVREHSQHVRLSGVQPLAALAPEHKATLAAAKTRADFEVNIPKYGAGLLAVLVP